MSDQRKDEAQRQLEGWLETWLDSLHQSLGSSDLSPEEGYGLDATWDGTTLTLRATDDKDDNRTLAAVRLVLAGEDDTLPGELERLTFAATEATSELADATLALSLRMREEEDAR